MMPTGYTLIQTWPYATGIAAKIDIDNGTPGDAALRVRATGERATSLRVVLGEPVILSGLVKGGELHTYDDWHHSLLAPHRLLVDAHGRAVSNTLHAFRAAEARGALPITWYRYEEP